MLYFVAGFWTSLNIIFIHTDDIQGWQDAVLKSLEKKHRAEQEFLMSLLQDDSSKGMREEARAFSEDERLKRLNELKAKREELDFGVKGDFSVLLLYILLSQPSPSWYFWYSFLYLQTNPYEQ